ncbi:MAG: hypothetical protein L0196_11630 [candidate division Zixibacteria bacterium]|nr:hypothetical protein [candidate division Zixibacteria bacterium]
MDKTGFSAAVEPEEPDDCAGRGTKEKNQLQAVASPIEKSAFVLTAK